MKGLPEEATDSPAEAETDKVEERTTCSPHTLVRRTVLLLPWASAKELSLTVNRRRKSARVTSWEKTSSMDLLLEGKRKPAL